MKFLFGFLQLTFVPYFVGVFLFPCPGRNLLTAHHLKSTRKIPEFGLMHDYVNAENSPPTRHVCENFLKPLGPSSVVSMGEFRLCICAGLEICGGLNMQFASSKRVLVMKFACLISLCIRLLINPRTIW